MTSTDEARAALLHLLGDATSSTAVEDLEAAIRAESEDRFAAYCAEKLHKAYDRGRAEAAQKVAALREAAGEALSSEMLPANIHRRLDAALAATPAEDPGLHDIAGHSCPQCRRVASRRARAATPAEDPLRASDLSMAEHSDTRSHCPRCGEWRDSPTADCAACGYTATGADE